MNYSKEEIIKHLTDELEEELEGIKKYDAMYHSLKAHDMHEEAKIVEAIARDEYKHACAIWDMLMAHGVDLTHHDKIQSGWGCVKKIFNI